MNIEYSILNLNGYNKDVNFSINGMSFSAGFTSTEDTVTDFCRNICFDVVNQETQRIFFNNFNQLLKYANN
jgi:hypothetical protein